MIQAFDVLLQIPVTADIAAKNRIDEPFRYECLCCGEEVYIAATNSTKKAPHFRHRRGNSDRECELYLGSTGIAGALNAAQKRTHSRTEIYFDIKQKIFYAAVSFPKEKLQEFEDKSCILEFHSTYNSPPYEKVRINHQNFAPDSMVQFPLKLTTNDCYITISGANYRSHYEILSNNDFPTFFKITLGENSGNFARRIVGGKIYTNTSYYIIAKNQKIIQKIVDLGENIAISAVDEINALGSTIYGATLEILSVTPDLSNLFSYFNYSLEVSENITPLWPPLYSVDGVLCSNKKKVYLLSSFTLVPHSNISCENDKLELFDDVFELDITLPVRISRNNVNMQRNSHLASTLSISPEALEKERKKYRTEIREKDSENKKKSKEIGILKAKIADLSATIETLQGELECQIIRIKQFEQTEVIQRKELHDAISVNTTLDAELKRLKAELREAQVTIDTAKKRESGQQATIDTLQSKLSEIQKVAEDLDAKIYRESDNLLCPVDIDEFSEYLGYNLSSIGVDSSTDEYFLLVDFLGDILFQDKPIICNRIAGIALAKCVSNTLCGSQEIKVLSYTSEVTSNDILNYLRLETRICVLDGFLGNYNEMELISIGY